MTRDEIVAQVRTIVEATRQQNEQSFDLIHEYLNRIIDLGDKETQLHDDVMSAGASEIKEVVVPLAPGCAVGFALIDGVCKGVYTQPTVKTNPLVAPLNVLVNFVGTILEPTVPKNVAEDIANQVKIRAEALVHEFENN